MEGKRSYKPDGLVIAEMVACVAGMLLLFASWVTIHGTNIDNEPITMYGPAFMESASETDGPAAYFMMGSLVLCLVLKFFMRATWMSAATAFMFGSQIYGAFNAIEQIREEAQYVGTAAHLGSLQAEPSIWCYAAILVEMIFICSVFVGFARWIKKGTRQRGKYLLIAAAACLTIAIVTKILSFSMVEDTMLTLNVITVFSVLAGVVCAVFGLLFWIKKEETSEMPDRQVDTLKTILDTPAEHLKEPEGSGKEAEEVVKEEENPIQTDNELGQPEQSKIRLWHYAIGIAVLLIVLGVFLVPHMQREEEDIDIQFLSAKPAIWDKFVELSDDAKFYKEPNVLTFHPSYAARGIVPVVDETALFYKIYDAGQGEAWVKKNHCQVVESASITEEQITDYVLDGQRLDCMTRTFKESSLAGLNMAFYLDANGEGHLVMVILDGNGRIISTGRSNVEARFVDTKGFNVVEGNDYEAARVEYGSDFLLKGKEDSHWLDLQKLSQRQVADVWSVTQGTSLESCLVTYFFPKQGHFKSFGVDLTTYSDASTDTSDAVETSVVVTAYSVLEKGNMEYDLMAEVNGQQVSTGLVWESALGLSVEHTADFDGDGSLDAIVYYNNGESTGGEYLLLCFFNKDKEKFEKIDLPCELPSFEEWKGRTSIVDKTGISYTRYVLEDLTWKEVERKTADVGRIVWTRTRENLFPDLTTLGEEEAWFDVDGDGTDDVIVFGHNDSHALDWGKNMSVERMECSGGIKLDGSATGLVYGARFQIVDRSTKGMADFLIDQHLYRWNGSAYVRWTFDGKKFVY